MTEQHNVSAGKAQRPKKVRLSADGTPYTVWQTRTRILCLALIAWGVAELGVGAVFIVLRFFGIDLAALLPVVTFGSTTVISGVFSLFIAVSGLWGAHNPRRITVFFWVVFVAALLNAWQVASLWSQGQVDPASLATLAISLAYAVCAWNVRGQTGYFDNHPKPEDEQRPTIDGESDKKSS